ncbi:conjugal transfer protein [Mucilaginibacter pedocola]|uniref:Conjugal transfer protein n=2 Tax=Mucilaginibacter pedocola TaxID=1792845 RepID=A0A1S9P8W6_9SPHI|nr:conjugal transfer protein [Mucilaginibacter pedocola]
MIQSKSAAHAKMYFNDALSKSDYYINDQELPGKFSGLLADRLGITGAASKDVFYELCDNINPATGGNLTPRTKEERTTGYDVNFHCPKSVSIIHALSNDDHILEAFEDAVNRTLKEIEADSMTRVRKGGKDENRKTGELIIAQFTHQTSRPVEGELPDCHLHQHAYIFNSTYDPIEKRIKAAQFREIKRDMPYYQARFHKRLSDNLIDLGYDIRVTDYAFEIAGVPKSAIDYMSKRTNEIGQYAKEHNISDPALLSEIGAKTRGKKQSGLSMAELKKAWNEQIGQQISYADGEKEQAIRYSPNRKEERLHVKECVDFALEHSFERASVMQERRLLANTVKHSIGERHIGIEAIENAISQDQRLIHVQQGHLGYYTTKEVLAEEREMVQLARKGTNRFKPLYSERPEIRYDGEQGEAIAHVLTSTDQTSIIRGVAGAGKTTSLLELDKLVQAAGKKTFIVTPMAKTAREQLPAEGFNDSDTVAKLLADTEHQEKLKNQVLIVDEAGQLGTKDMVSLLNVADKQNCRLVLVGDTRQHTAVLRGDALRVVNTIGNIPTAEVSKIYRQRSNAQYLAAVEDLSKGDVESAFDKLDNMGAIKSIDPLKPNKELVEDYMAAVKKKKTALVVSPTRKQGQAVSKEIRAELQKAGLIGKREIAAKKLENLNFTDAQKADWRKYEPGQVIQFSQNVPKIKRGSVWQLKEVKDNLVTMENESGEQKQLPLEKASSFNVYRSNEILLAKGDQIKITQGGFDIDDTRLNNGQTMNVVKVSKNGDVHLRNNQSKATYRISKDFGHIDHDYCSTSHLSQGKTVDVVLISQPADTFSATNAKQFYVSVSRGKENVTIYTDDKDKLLENAAQLGDRKSAMELVGDEPIHHEHIAIQELDKQRAYQHKENEKELLSKDHNRYYEDYEPRL